MIFDPMYFVFLAPGLLLSLWASFRVKRAFNKYSKVRSVTGMTGAQAAQRLLAYAGITDVQVVATRGRLSDHYNPVTRKLALSEQVYGSNSVAAIGIACHEAGHAIQHAKKYAPLWLRSTLVPMAGIGSNLGYFVMFFGLILGSMQMFLVGVVMFSAVVLFQLVTLPVEFDATARAKRLAVDQGLILQTERVGMDRVLNAAGLTYVAAAVSSLLTLFYFLVQSGFLGDRD